MTAPGPLMKKDSGEARSATLKVLIVDDHRLFREGLQNLLLQNGTDVVAAVGDGNEGVALARELKPDIVLLDLRMPSTDGIRVLKMIKATQPELPVVILTTSSTETDLLDALKSGANGYLLKDMQPEDLVNALQDIHRSDTIVAPSLAPTLVSFIQGNLTTREASGPFSTLTPRESEIIKLLSEGQGNKVIARNLGISDGTVKLHVKSILKKLNAHSRVEAAVKYVEHNYQKV